MNSIRIKNIDENGVEIKNDVDWSKWERVSVEEVLDDKEEVVEILSHCRKYTTEELQRQFLAELAATEGEDVQKALCELAEQQASYEDDVNAALCELYELIAGGESNG